MLRLSEHLRTARTGDGTVLLDIRHGQMFAINPTGSRIVELLQLGASETEIPSLLVREFSVDPTTAESDTAEFVQLLRQYALVDSGV